MNVDVGRAASMEAAGPGVDHLDQRAMTSGEHHRDHREGITTQVGIEGPYVRYMVVGAAIFVGCMATGSIGGATGTEVVAVVGPPLVISGGLLAFAALDRSAGEAVAAIALAALTIGLVMAELDLDLTNLVLTSTYGAVWLGAGLVYRKLQH